MGTLDSPPGGTGTTPIPVSPANGVYEVVSVGGGGSSWSLARATNIDTGSAIEAGYVITTEGSYRATATGQAFALSYESLGIDPMTATPLAAGQPTTNIGTDDINDLTTFVVSSTAGSNAAAGSLGKMISLRQQLASSSLRNPTPKVDFVFSSVLPGLNGSSAGVIRLTQELPTITKAFAINGATRVKLPGVSGPSVNNITVDGSRITSTRTGQPADSAPEVNGFEFVSGSGPTVGAAGGSIANLTVGGFAKGSAVKINGVNGILVNKMVLGRSETGDRLSSRFGVLASGAGAGGSVVGTTIVGSLQAGIRTEAGADGLSIVGTTIGALNQANVTGLELTTGITKVGLDSIGAIRSPIATTRGLSFFTLPAAISPRSLHIAQGVAGPGIASGTTVAAIHGRTISLSKPMTATGVTTAIFLSSTARNVVKYNLTGMELSGGNNTVTNTDIGNNVYDGIVVSGGTQTIGTAQKINVTSNAIFGNGGFGVKVINWAAYVITGNNFGRQGENKQGDIIINDVNGNDLPAFRPNAQTRLDRNGNFHAPSGTASIRRRITWR